MFFCPPVAYLLLILKYKNEGVVLMKNLRIGIIGTGAISNRHMKVWSHIPQVEVVAAAEIDEKKLNAWNEQYKVKNIYTDFREML
jgi:predicted dehydrogenase